MDIRWILGGYSNDGNTVNRSDVSVVDLDL